MKYVCIGVFCLMGMHLTAQDLTYLQLAASLQFTDSTDSWPEEKGDFHESKTLDGRFHILNNHTELGRAYYSHVDAPGWENYSISLNVRLEKFRPDSREYGYGLYFGSVAADEMYNYRFLLNDSGQFIIYLKNGENLEKLCEYTSCPAIQTEYGSANMLSVVFRPEHMFFYINHMPVAQIQNLIETQEKIIGCYTGNGYYASYDDFKVYEMPAEKTFESYPAFFHTLILQSATGFSAEPHNGSQVPRYARYNFGKSTTAPYYVSHYFTTKTVVYDWESWTEEADNYTFRLTYISKEEALAAYKELKESLNKAQSSYAYTSSLVIPSTLPDFNGLLNQNRTLATYYFLKSTGNSFFPDFFVLHEPEPDEKNTNYFILLDVLDINKQDYVYYAISGAPVPGSMGSEFMTLWKAVDERNLSSYFTSVSPNNSSYKGLSVNLPGAHCYAVQEYEEDPTFFADYPEPVITTKEEAYQKIAVRKDELLEKLKAELGSAYYLSESTEIKDHFLLVPFNSYKPTVSINLYYDSETPCYFIQLGIYETK